jgi:hypothetical protein
MPEDLTKILGEPENKTLENILGKPAFKKKDETIPSLSGSPILPSPENNWLSPQGFSLSDAKKFAETKLKLSTAHVNVVKPLTYSLRSKEIDNDLIDVVSKIESTKPVKDDNVEKGYLGGSVNSLYKAMAGSLNFFGDVLDDIDTALDGVPGYIFSRGNVNSPPAQTKAVLQEQFLKEQDPEKKKQLGDVINSMKRETNPFYQVADWYNESAESFKEMPDNVAGDILTGVVGVVPLLLELAVVPEVRLGKIAGQAINIPKLGTLEGVKGYYSGTKIEGTTKEKLQSGVLGGLSGVSYGTILHGLGVGSNVLGNIVGDATKSQILKGTTAAVANGLGFGGYDAYDQYVRTGEIDPRRVAASTGTGIGLSIYGVPGMISDAQKIQKSVEKAATEKAFSNFMTASPKTIDFVNQLDIDPVKLREESIRLGEEAIKATTPEEKNKLLTSKKIVDSMLDINAISKDVILHPDNYKDIINGSNLEPEAKEAYLKKVDRVVANNAELQSLVDENILAAREKGITYKEPELFIDKETANVFEAIDAKVPVINERLQAASDNLYNEYKRLESVKLAKTRTNTIGEINEAQAFLEKEITNLENKKNAQRESGMFMRSRGKAPGKQPTKEELKEQGLSDKKIDKLLEQSKPIEPAKEKFDKLLGTEEELTPEEKELQEKYGRFGNAENELEVKNEPLDIKEDIIKGGQENAIQERGAETLPMGETPRDSKEMGTRIPEPEKSAETRQENAPPGANVKEAKKIDFKTLKTPQEFSSALESEIVQTRQEKLTAKEMEIKDRLAERLAKLSGSQFAVGEKKPEVAKEIFGVISDLSELGLIKIEKGVDYVIEQVKKYLPNITDDDIKKYQGDIEGFIKDPRLSGIKKSLVPESKIEETEIEKRTIEEIINKGKQMVDDNVIDPKILVDEVNKSPRPLNADEVGALIYYKTQLDNKFDEAYDRVNELRAKGADDGSSKMILDAINKDIDAFHEAALNSGYEQGLSFRARQALLDSEYNLTTQIRKYKQVNHGEIPPGIEKRFQEYDRQLQDLNKQLRDVARKKEKEESRSLVQNIRETKPVIRKRGKDLMAEGFDELMSALGGKTMALGEEAPSVTKALSKIGRGLIDEGIATIDNVMEKISEYLSGKGKDVDISKYREGILSGIKETAGIKVDKNGKVKIPHDLIRDYVERGIEDINDLVSTIKKDYGLDMTDRELRDIITNYGKTVSMNKEDIEVKIREMRRIGRAVSGLEDVKKAQKRPLRSGLQRDKLSDKERRLQKELKEAIKELPQTEAEMEGAWKSALDGVKTRLKNQIADLQNRIETGEKTPKRKGIKYDAEANSLKEQRDKLKEIVEQIDGNTGTSDEQKVRKAVSNAENLIKEYERRIKEKDFSKMNKPSTTPVTPELEAARKRLKDIRSTYQKLRDITGTTDQMRLDRIKENIKKSIQDYERRIKEKDYSKKTRVKPEFDAEAARLEIERAKVRYQYDKDVEKARLKSRGFGEKSKEIFMDIFNMPKSLMASADFSAPLRQGALLSFGNPRQAAAATKEMFRHAFSSKKAEEWLHKLQATDEYVLMHNSKLYLSEPTAKLAAKEEQFMTNLAHKIPIWGKVVSGSERAYVGYLNKLRADVFNKGAKHLLDQGYTFKTNPEVFKSWADFINNATGRGGLGPLEKSAAVLNTAFFSPRFVMSRINLMNPVKYVKMPKDVRMMAMKNVLSFLGTVMTVTTLAKLAGAEVEDDPRSSDFGKIKIGKLRFDMLAGFQQPFRAAFQIFSGERKSASTGIVRDLDPDRFPYTSRGDVAFQFVRSKLSPSASLIVDLLEGQTMLGEDLNAKSLALDRVIPLYLQDIKDIAKEEGIPLTSASALASLFGVGVQYYAEKNVVRQGISDGLTFEEIKAKKQAESDKPLTPNAITKLKKEYKAYKEFGLDNEQVNFLLQSGLTNEEKAQYLVDEKIDSATFRKYKEYNLISKELEKQYKALKKP